MPSSGDCHQAAAGVARGRRSANATTITDILDAAKEEFANRGFDSATVDSICRRAKVSKQLLYYYFGSKSDLYTLILREAAEGTSNLIESTQYRALPPEAALTKFMQNLFRDHIDRPQIAQMTIDEAQHSFAHVGKKSPLATVLRKLIDEILGEIVERGCSDGSFRAGVDADQLFWVIFSLVTTWFSHFPLVSLVHRTGGGADMDVTAWCANSVDFVLAAIRNRP